MSEFRVSIALGVSTAIIVALGIAAAVFVLSPPNLESSCSGFPPGGNCLTYTYTFTISVNYSGPWKLTYQAYNSLGRLNPMSVSGSYNGTGFFSKDIALSSPSNKGLTLCGTAQKLDASNSLLVLRIIASNQTSLAYGSTFLCNGVAP